MQCPNCGMQCKEGVIEARDPRYLIINWPAELRWYPKEYEDKFFKKEKLYLPSESVGYFCSNCHKVYAAFNVELYSEPISDNETDEEE